MSRCLCRGSKCQLGGIAQHLPSKNFCKIAAIQMTQQSSPTTSSIILSFSTGASNISLGGWRINCALTDISKVGLECKRSTKNALVLIPHRMGCRRCIW